MENKASNDLPRWRYRFQNFSKAISLLKEAVLLSNQKELSYLEQEGVIKRFEYTWELSWKLLKDYLEANGINLSIVSPNHVFRTALAANLFQEERILETLLEATADRNKMAHTYNEQDFQVIFQAIREDYYPALNAIFLFFQQEVACNPTSL